jgi:hypothetical protein
MEVHLARKTLTGCKDWQQATLTLVGFSFLSSFWILTLRIAPASVSSALNVWVALVM